MEDILYNRQESIKLINYDGYIAVIGCGGVGYHVAKMLAMSGVKKLKLFDNDTLELSNLNRIDLPYSFVGRNKAEATKVIINKLRPECEVKVYPFKFNEKFSEGISYIVDCTDKISSQRTNEEIAKNLVVSYLKIGYNGTHMTISNKVARWSSTDTEDEGYTIVPSWIVPATVVAALGVAVVLRYINGEFSADLNHLLKG